MWSAVYSPGLTLARGAHCTIMSCRVGLRELGLEDEDLGLNPDIAPTHNIPEVSQLGSFLSSFRL